MKLSKAQQEVVNSLKSGLFIFTSEGEDTKAWLGDENGHQPKYIRLRTVEILYTAGIIRLDDRFYHRRLYKYALKVV